jgi:hypothetical protein
MSTKNTGLMLATIAAWFTEAAYAISPIDLVPDILPVVGLLDDLFGLILVLAFTAYTIHRIYSSRGLPPMAPEEGAVVPHRAISAKEPTPP